ncbi:unnamed protein product [Meloidogyne enterolobii]|uniref:Uncharacterized protein n=2 Tax=Meloidogyne enterolobii TaxID=390850 RepID=A0ACB1A9L8_MELEN
MEELECKNSLELVEKLGSRVRVFWDRYNGSRRVAVIKTLKNSSFLNQIDREIEDSVADVAKAAGVEWGKLSASEKSVWEKKAAYDMKRYEADMEVYRSRQSK